MLRPLVRYVVWLLAPWLAGCTTAASVDGTVVGPDGGTVESGPVTLEIPAGALDGPTVIQIESAGPMPGWEPSTDLFVFAPDGLDFAVPATVSFRLDTVYADPHVYWSEGEGFVRLGTTVAAGRASARIEHFSTGLVAEVEVCPPGPDSDGDGVCDPIDNCPTEANTYQEDADGDGFGDPCDVCTGDDATLDPDADGSCSDTDNCPSDSNPSQDDTDLDGVGDACDACVGDDATGDPDGDDRCTSSDNCPVDANPSQGDSDSDGVGDACDACVGDDAVLDADADGICLALDNCPADANADQADADHDGVGDPCDVCAGDDGLLDADADGACYLDDNCPEVANPGQEDGDLDGVGDACDACVGDDAVLDPDHDGVCTPDDNCPAVANDQTDSDGDGVGDPCDLCIGFDGSLDPDEDGLCTDRELAYGSDPTDADSDDDSLPDGRENADGDAVVDADETDALDPDSNDDGACDGYRFDNDGDGIDPVDDCTFAWRVDDDNTGSADGLTWQTAFPSLEEAVAVAVPGQELWVARGTYRASAATASVLTAIEDLAVRGGFLGTEAVLAERPATLSGTVLDGDFDASGGPTAGDSHHVVVGASGLVLDGVEIVGGYDTTGAGGAGVLVPAASSDVVLVDVLVAGNEATGANARGGGMKVMAGSQVSLLRVAIASNRTIVSANLGASEGAGLWFDDSDATLAFVSVSDNVAWSVGDNGDVRGVGIRAVGGSLSIRDTVISANSGLARRWAYGGGLFTDGVGLDLQDTTLEGNVLTNVGATGTFGGGLWSGYADEHVMIDVDVVDNEAREGAGAHLQGGAFTCERCVFSGNEAVARAGGLYVRDATTSIVDTIVTGNVAGEGGGLYVLAQGVTIDGGEIGDNRSTGDFGGGVVSSQHDLVVRDVWIHDNEAGEEGGGLRVWSDDGLVERCLVQGNLAAPYAQGQAYGGGGGLNLAGKRVTVRDSLIVENEAGGGAGLASSNDELTIERTTIAFNRAVGSTDVGSSAIAAVSLDVDIVDSTIVGNVTELFVGGVQGGAITGQVQHFRLIGSTVADNRIEVTFDAGSQGAGWLVHDRSESTFTVANTILWNNTGGGSPTYIAGANTQTYSHTCADEDLGDASLAGLSSDPFDLADIDQDGFDEWYLATDSPCVDAGDDAIATAAGIAWTEATTRSDGAVDATPVDIGRHYPTP